MSVWNIAFSIVWKLCKHLQYESVQIEWTLICRITTQKILSYVVALSSCFLHFYCKPFISDANSPPFGGRLTLFCLVSRSPALVRKYPAFYVHYKY